MDSQCSDQEWYCSQSGRRLAPESAGIASLDGKHLHSRLDYQQQCLVDGNLEG
jgi:hypothetical protein